MRIREVKKHADPTDPEADSEHWYIYKDKKSYRSYKTVEIKAFLTIITWWWKDPDPDPWNLRIRMRIREAQKHTDPDADPDPQHWITPTSYL